jgi:iron complex transport system substrate-binding protein
VRIVSLLPAATEIVCALGLEEQLVGVSHECDYPLSVRDLPKVTRSLIPTSAPSGEIDRLVRERLSTQSALYSLDLAVLDELAPDLIVTQALCDVCAVAQDEVQAAACALPNAPRVINLEPQNLREVLQAVRQVANATGTQACGDLVARQLQARIDVVTERCEQLAMRPRVALIEWLDPPFSCGHWNPELVRLAGGIEGLGREGERSRTLTWDEVIAWQPEVVLFACCGLDVERTLGDLPLLKAVAGWQDVPAVRSGRVYVTDGAQYFSRPGPRLVDSLEILAHVLHPDVHPLPNGLPAALCVDAAFREIKGFHAEDAEPPLPPA